MTTSKLRKYKQDIEALYKSNSYGEINLKEQLIAEEIEILLSETLNKKSYQRIIFFKFLIKHFKNTLHAKSHIFNTTIFIKTYGDHLLKNLTPVKTSNDIIYDFNDMLILKINKKTNFNITSLLKEHLTEDIIRVNKNDKIYYYIPNYGSFLPIMRNYIKSFTDKVLISKKDKIDIFIGFESCKPYLYSMQYKDEGLLFNMADFNTLKDIDKSFSDMLDKITFFKHTFVLDFKKNIKLAFNKYFMNFNVDSEYDATANKKNQEIRLYSLVTNKQSRDRLIAHEIGHFYYWKYNNKGFNSKEFFKDFKYHYKRIKFNYNCHYFQFNPNGKYKFNKISEYYCEIFSLYVTGELKKEDLKVFEKYIKFK